MIHPMTSEDVASFAAIWAEANVATQSPADVTYAVVVEQHRRDQMVIDALEEEIVRLARALHGVMDAAFIGDAHDVANEAIEAATWPIHDERVTGALAVAEPTADPVITVDAHPSAQPNVDDAALRLLRTIQEGP